MTDTDPGRGEQPAEPVTVADPVVVDDRELDGIEPWSFTKLVPMGRPGAWVLLIAGILGLVASGALTIERIKLLQDSSYIPSCSINPILSCGSVMTEPQAAFFGFPNPLIGIGAFSVIVVTGVLAAAGIRLPWWYWLGQTIASAAGLVFVFYLIYSSLYSIHALCPYCMVVWAVMPIILVLSAGRLLDHSVGGRAVRGWLWTLTPVLYIAVIVAIGVEFWYYWRTLF